MMLLVGVCALWLRLAWAIGVVCTFPSRQSLLRHVLSLITAPATEQKAATGILFLELLNAATPQVTNANAKKCPRRALPR